MAPRLSVSLRRLAAAASRCSSGLPPLRVSRPGLALLYAAATGVPISQTTLSSGLPQKLSRTLLSVRPSPVAVAQLAPPMFRCTLRHCLTCSPASKSERQIVHIGLAALSFSPAE